MNNLLPSLTKCCFCVPLEPGLLIWAYVKLAINISIFRDVSSRLLRLVEYNMENAELRNPWYFKFLTTLLILMCCLFLFYLIFNLILIVGAHKKNTALLIIFFWYAVVHAVLFFIIGTVLTLIVSIFGTLESIILALIWITYCTSLVFNIYEIFLVSSVILKLKLATNGQVQIHTDSGSP